MTDSQLTAAHCGNFAGRKYGHVLALAATDPMMPQPDMDLFYDNMYSAGKTYANPDLASKYYEGFAYGATISDLD
jgi:hypothetical protein